MRKLLLISLLLPLPLLADLKTYSINGEEYVAFDESIKAYVRNGENLVYYYTRFTENNKKDISGNPYQQTYIHQNIFNCDTNFYIQKTQSQGYWSDQVWSTPDSLIRASGEYVCKKVKTGKIKPEIIQVPHQEPVSNNGSVKDSDFECLTDGDCSVGLHCRTKPVKGSECK